MQAKGVFGWQDGEDAYCESVECECGNTIIVE